ncbi:hypothetical protein EML15_04465 [Corynebacterium sp. sy017]|uniref:hypothetical protein n=1 Tax=unclassified Corynebacterium TaxID=2624378 RepID=UPI0011865CD9|nr:MULTISPECIES: hypothetical protein [unclassified Corynebacterium]MBP3088399.1 hypothetical protein [Corynebacterium sp. sy017]QDZ41841.1 hypothetical protein FQV43_00655 [Corynebacterium sp. sy039]TSD91713.1 hypothetical protein ELY17_04465 [Corynebacterium sp. SY003]
MFALYTLPGIAAALIIGTVLLCANKILISKEISARSISRYVFLAVGIGIWLLWTLLNSLPGTTPAWGYVPVTWGFFLVWLLLSFAIRSRSDARSAAQDVDTN